MMSKPKNEDKNTSFKQPEDAESNTSSDLLDDDDNEESKVNAALDINSSIENSLTFNHAQVQNVTIMPQDLRKSDKNIKQQSKSEIPPISSAAPCRHSYDKLDDDIYTITAADQTMSSSSLQITSIDGFFNRKRGRPPKNRFVEVYKNTQQKPQAIFTSFKLEKQGVNDTMSNAANSPLQNAMANSMENSLEKRCSTEYTRLKASIKNLTQLKRTNRITKSLSTQGLRSYSRLNAEQIIDENSQNSIVHMLINEDKYLSNKIKNDSGGVFDNSRESAATHTSPKMTLMNLQDCDMDTSRGTGHCGQKPTYKSLTRENPLSRITISSTESANSCTALEVRKIKSFDENSQSSIAYMGTNDFQNIIQNQSESLIELWNDRTSHLPINSRHKNDKVNKESTAFTTDSLPLLKKPKLCETTDNVTVIRAAGTFYPENSSDTACRKHVEKTSNISPIADETAQNLSLKDKIQNIADHYEASSNSTMTAIDSSDTCATNFSQFYNVFEMQQQLLAFYQQIALMAPAFSQLIHSLGQNNTTSVTAATEPETVLPKFTNITTPQDIQSGNMPELTTECQPEDYLRQLQRNPTNRSQTATEHKIPEKQFQCLSEDTPLGYKRFHFHQDCGYEKCGYRQHQSHYHCNRYDCQYSFCDKTRFVQHTARHERLDTLMGDDFQQYRPTMPCNYSSCVLNNGKFSHFHCLKCSFFCGDTSKVVSHRRFHNKMESLRLAGFRKVSINENCLKLCSNAHKNPAHSNKIFSSVTDIVTDDNSLEGCSTEIVIPHCPYALRNTHYHCLVCNCSVLTRSQMLAHKHLKTGTIKQHHPFEKAKLPPKNQEAKDTKCD